ncbi:glycoside hydrolase family 2 protein [Athelia psychrophila]|uniref:Glycoside hydrolase family 2 protein n=1 Tax=Athelia psychrophila TaxID=1759441 RepID=A0A166GDW8_9AGAM|nr:glycoside hydrolase family 2 protein [Fibularhizoctonia sp. CBS 109695]
MPPTSSKRADKIIELELCRVPRSVDHPALCLFREQLALRGEREGGVGEGEQPRPPRRLLAASQQVISSFVANVLVETSQQVRRINHHRSLALWAGNEIEYGLLRLGAAALTEQYGGLFPELDDKRVPGPGLGGGSMVEWPGNVTEGSVCRSAGYYDYDANMAYNISTYPARRSANEHGFHSPPSPQTYAAALPAAALAFNSSCVLSRNHHYPINLTSHGVRSEHGGGDSERGRCRRGEGVHAPLRRAAAVGVLLDPQLRLRYPGSSSFVVDAQALAAFVWLDHPADVRGYWNDNGFWVLLGTRTVTLTVLEDSRGGKWVDEVVVDSLWMLASSD